LSATQIRERINDHVAKATALREGLEAKLDAGTQMEDSAFQEGFAQAESHLEAADTLRDTLHRQENFDAKASNLKAWQVLPADGSEPPPPVPGADAPAASDLRIGPHNLRLSRAAWNPALGEAAYRDALERQLHSIAAPGFYEPVHRDVLQAGIDELGGFLMAPDQQANVLSRLAERSRILDMTTPLPTAREMVTWWRVQPASGGDASIYSSGFIGSFVAEIPGSTAGETEPNFGRLNIAVDKMRTKTFLGRDFVADTDFDILAFLERNGGENLGLVAQKAVLVGSGVDEPLGIFADPDIPAATDISGTTTDEISNTTSDLGSATKLMDLQYALPPQYWGNAVWAMHQLEELNIRKLVDANGLFIWAAGFADRPNELLGFPVVRSSFIAEGGTDGNKVVAWGDFSQYITPRRMAVSAQLDPFTKTDVEQVVFYLRTRLGGRLTNPDAFRIGKV
jgi:HK97 family phage major capsid protein